MMSIYSLCTTKIRMYYSIAFLQKPNWPPRWHTTLNNIHGLFARILLSVFPYGLPSFPHPSSFLSLSHSPSSVLPLIIVVLVVALVEFYFFIFIFISRPPRSKCMPRR